MRLSVKATTIVTALLWGASILFVGLINLIDSSYGVEFLKIIGSVYPGFHGSGTFGDVLIGTLYGVLDGAVGGCLIGWLYNVFVSRAPQT